MFYKNIIKFPGKFYIRNLWINEFLKILFEIATNTRTSMAEPNKFRNLTGKIIDFRISFSGTSLRPLLLKSIKFTKNSLHIFR